jgi:hypothetical protein
MNCIKLPLEPHHLGVPTGASKMISEPMVCLAQTVHLSCTDTNTISKRTKTRFHMTHITLEFYRVSPKWFLGLWYIQRKPCTNLASRLALSPNRLNGATTWASSLRSTIGCVQKISEPMVCLAQSLHQSWTDTNTVSKWTKTRFHTTHVT